jgi:hypothetical protein
MPLHTTYYLYRNLYLISIKNNINKLDAKLLCIDKEG